MRDSRSSGVVKENSRIIIRCLVGFVARVMDGGCRVLHKSIRFSSVCKFCCGYLNAN